MRRKVKQLLHVSKRMLNSLFVTHFCKYFYTKWTLDLFFAVYARFYEKIAFLLTPSHYYPKRVFLVSRRNRTSERKSHTAALLVLRLGNYRVLCAGKMGDDSGCVPVNIWHFRTTNCSWFFMLHWHFGLEYGAYGKLFGQCYRWAVRRIFSKLPTYFIALELFRKSNSAFSVPNPKSRSRISV